MTILEKKPFLPFKAYDYLKEQSNKDHRDYVAEFSIQKKLKKAKVVVDKTYFHSAQSESTKRKAFVVKDDEVIIDLIDKDWVKVAYEGKQSTTEGWLNKSDIEILN